MKFLEKVKELITIKEEGVDEMVLSRDYKSGLVVIATELMNHILYDEYDDSWYEPILESLLLIRRNYLKKDFDTAISVAGVLSGFLCEGCKMKVHAFACANREAMEYYLSELTEMIEDTYPDEVDADDDVHDIEW